MKAIESGRELITLRESFCPDDLAVAMEMMQTLIERYRNKHPRGAKQAREATHGLHWYDLAGYSDPNRRRVLNLLDKLGVVKSHWCNDPQCGCDSDTSYRIWEEWEPVVAAYVAAIPEAKPATVKEIES